MVSKEELRNIDLKNLIERETGQKFDRDNKICCPFHNEKTPSFSIKKYNDKWRYYCYGCECKGDSVDFIKEYKHMTYNEACEYLGLEVNEEYKTYLSLLEKVKQSAKNIKFKGKDEKPLKYKTTYVFVDQSNNPLYFKVKFKNSNNISESRYLHINEKNIIVPGRGNNKEVPYNYNRLLDGLKNEKAIFICEGEKDTDTLQYMGYIATSFKGVTDFDYSIFKNAIVYITPDVGIPGEKYKDDLYYKLKDYVKEFNVIYPHGWDKYPSNFDITDWFQEGHTKEDFKAALNDKWDYIKNRNFKYVTSNGAPRKIWENFERICELNKIIIRYNELSKKLEFTGTVFNIENNNAACMEDLYSLCVRENFNISKANLKDFVFRVSQANSYNPAKDYLNNCYENWDYKEGYIKQLADTIITTDDYDNTFKELLLKKWLIGTANIAFNDGTQNMNGVLVIQGPQGIGKTRWIKTLLPNQHWIDTDKYINPKKVDDVVDVTSALIVELGELKTSLKKDTIDTLKMFFTRTKDRYRRPYGANAEEYPRVTSFYATINNNEFLEDSTGNRRYWCIRVNSMLVEHNINIDQLWGEVMYLLKDKKEPHWLTKEEEKQLYDINSTFEVKTDSETRISDVFNWSLSQDQWIYKPLTQICDELGFNKITSEVRDALKKCGAIPPKDNKPFRVHGYKGSKKWWFVPPMNFSVEDDNPFNNGGATK